MTFVPFPVTRTQRRRHMADTVRVERLEEDADEFEVDISTMRDEIRTLTKQISDTGNRVLVGLTVSALMLAADIAVRVAG